MLKKLFLLSLISLSSINCNKIITIYAQSLPTTRTFAWDANPASDGVTSYGPQLDGVDLPMSNPLATSVSFTITTVGQHTLRVNATNLYGPGPYSTLTFNVVIPSAPPNLRIQ